MTATRHIRSDTRRFIHEERGGSALQAAILAPVLLILLALVIATGRVGQAHSVVDTAAAEASRAASIERSPGKARAAATAAARSALTSKGITCPVVVTVDTSGFGAPVGTVATVSARVQCTVPLGDLAVPGLPGSRTIDATSTSALDTYRERS